MFVTSSRLNNWTDFNEIWFEGRSELRLATNFKVAINTRGAASNL